MSSFAFTHSANLIWLEALTATCCWAPHKSSCCQYRSQMAQAEETHRESQRPDRLLAPRRRIRLSWIIPVVPTSPTPDISRFQVHRAPRYLQPFEVLLRMRSSWRGKERWASLGDPCHAVLAMPSTFLISLRALLFLWFRTSFVIIPFKDSSTWSLRIWLVELLCFYRS